MGKHVGGVLQGKTFKRVIIAILTQQCRGFLHLTVRLQHFDGSTPQGPVFARRQ